MATNRNKKDEAEFLRLQLEISEAIERQTKGVESYNEAQKTLMKNVKLFKVLTAEINALEAEKVGKSKKQIELIDEQISSLKKQQNQLKTINKELSSMKNAMRAVGNELLTWAKNIKSQLIPGFNSIYDKSQAIDKSIRNTSASLGLSSSVSGVMRANINGASLSANALNVTTEELAEIQKSYSDETGRSALLSQSTLINTVELSRALNMSVTEMASLTGQMEAFGFGAEKSLEIVRDVRDIAQAQGVDAGKIVKKFGQNLKLLNKLDFKGGVKGMAKMAAFSEKYKISMESIAALSEKVFRPEGAIEAASNLQMLGGGLSQLGDPFKLMYDARYAPEELAKSLTKAVVTSAKFNKETKGFDMNALELDRMREAASALGMDYTELVESAKQTAKINMFKGMLPSNMDKKDVEMLSGLASFNESGQATVSFIDENGNRLEKTLSQMTPKLVADLKEKQKSNEDLAKQNQTFQEAWNGLKEQLINLGSQVLLPMVETLKPFIVGMVDWIKGLGTFGKTVSGLAIIFGGVIGNAAMWVARGVMMRKGFDGAGEGKGVMKSLFSKKGGGGGSQQYSSPIGPQMKPNVVSNGIGETPNTNGKQGGFLDKLKGIKPAQLLAVGGAMLMIGGALWIISDALVNLKAGNVGLNEFLGLGGMMIGMAVTLGILGAVAEGASLGLLAAGGAMLMMGAGVALATLGLTKLFKSIGPNGDSIMKAGVGFLAMGVGIGVLTASLWALTASSIGVLPALGILTALSGILIGTAFALEKASFSVAIEGINEIDTNRLSMLKDLVALRAKGKPIKVEFGDIGIDGDISLSGEGGGKSSTDWINDPTFVSKLKNIIIQELEKGKNGNAN
jgi:hypothetical protein